MFPTQLVCNSEPFYFSLHSVDIFFKIRYKRLETKAGGNKIKITTFIETMNYFKGKSFDSYGIYKAETLTGILMTIIK